VSVYPPVADLAEVAADVVLHTHRATREFLTDADPMAKIALAKRIDSPARNAHRQQIGWNGLLLEARHPQTFGRGRLV
jgi:hypothetical protein